MSGVIDWFAKNHIAANLLLFLLVFAGLAGLYNMPQKTFPDIDVPIIVVSIPYLGAAPEEVESGVCVRVEEELDGIEGIKELRSTSNEGLCSVSVELRDDADTAKALDDVKNRVDSIDTFPRETEKPIINLISSVRSVIDIAITGPEDEKTLKVIGQRVRDDIATLPNVTQVTLANTRPYEISIELSEASLRRNGLSFDTVAKIIRTRSLDLPGGSIKTSGGEILLRTKGQAYWGDEFENLVLLSRADGSRLYLRDVATVVDGFKDTDQMLRFNGKPAALIKVSRIGNQDIQEITREVEAYLASAPRSLPAGVELTIWNDSSKLLKDRLSTLLQSARQGFMMVLLLLALFLRPRLAFWVSLGVPVAFLGALFMTNFLGLSIDSISLFGFILVLGIMVDDAIVVGENVYSSQLRSGSLLQGAITGTQQVSVPVIFGVLTTICTFFPLIVGPGTFGQIGGVIATVVVCCLVFSLVESQLVLPAHLGHEDVKTSVGEIGLLMIPIVFIILLEFASDMRTYLALLSICVSLVMAVHWSGHSKAIAERIMAAQTRFSDWLEHQIDNGFRQLVKKSTQARYITLAIALAAFMSGIGIVMSGRLPFSFFPPLASDQAIAQLTMPLGTPVEVTRQAVMRLEKTAFQLSEDLKSQFPESPPVRHVLTAVGNHPISTGGPGPPGTAESVASGGHLGEVTLQLTPSETRNLETAEVANLWRQQSGSVAGAVELRFTSALFTVGDAIDIQLAGDNVDDLRIAAARLRERLSEYPGVIDITDSFRSGKQELKLKMLPSGEALGLSLDSLGRQVRQAFYGEEAQRIQRGRDDVRGMVRYTREERKNLATLDSMRVRTSDGAEVPFAVVADAELGRGFSSIRRTDRQRVVNVTADVLRDQTTANEVLADLRARHLTDIMKDYPRIQYSLEGEQREQGEYFGSLVPLFLISLFLVYALLAVPLQSYAQPLIIMSVIPFAFLGAIWGHQIMKLVGLVSGLAMMSILGFIAASGVVVNSSLVLVHNLNARRAAGESLVDAVVNASVSRCRPIVLTSLTTFAGLAPLMFNTSVQAQFLVPMAVSLAFGVLFATLVTLLVVPSSYLFFEDVKAWRASGKVD